MSIPPPPGQPAGPTTPLPGGADVRPAPPWGGAAGWPPPPPGGPGGWPPPAPAPVSGLAVAALVTACLFLFPVALPLGIVALVTMERDGERGRGMAITAVVLASVEALVVIVLVIVGVALDEDDGGRPAGSREQRKEQRQPSSPRSITPDAIEVGDCFDTSAGLEAMEDGRTERTVRLVPCDRPHDAEAFGKFTVTGHDTYPGESVLEGIAEKGCDQRDREYPTDPSAVPDDLYVFYYYPWEMGWSLGDQEVLCFYGLEEGKLRHRLGAGEAPRTSGHVTVRLQSPAVTAQVVRRVGDGS